MLSIFLSIAGGIVAGYFLRNRRFVKHTGVLLSAIIVLLLFFLGISVGTNGQVIHNFASIGWDAFVLTVGGTLGCILCAWWVYVRFFHKKEK